MSPADIQTVLYRLDAIEQLVREQNGRVRVHDVQLAWMKGALAVVTFVLPVAAAVCTALLA